MRQLTLPAMPPRKGAPRGASRTRKTAAMRRSPHWVLRLRRAAIIGAAALVVLSAGLAAWRHGGFDAMGAALVAWTGKAGVAVREVLVVGRVETPADQILAALDVRKGSPLLAFSPEAARERLLALGWVREARVERRFPSVVYVHLEERHPAAIWQYDGQLALVDRSGVVIGADDVARYADLRVIVGPDAPQQFAALFAVLETRPAMLAHVTAAIRVGGRRWNLRLSDGMTVLLPERDVATAWQVLADAVRDAALMERDVVHIDLRLPGRLVLRLTPDAARPGVREDRGA